MSSASPPVADTRAVLLPSAARAIIRHHSASFSLASLLLGRATRENAHVLYAYCRRADDAIDLATPARAKSELERLRGELGAIYAGRALREPVASEFQRLVFELELPREYPEALLQGFELDVSGARYTTMFELHRYCWCVAGSVGAMMCHVLGSREAPAIVHGVHLGMAMQLTNLCRDVAEDWKRGRLYIPIELLPGWAQLETASLESWPPPPRNRRQLAAAVERLLTEADVFYRSGDAGLPYLSWRARVAVATARRVYSAIGQRLLARQADVTAARAVVPTSRKLWCAAQAVLDALPTTSAPTPQWPSGPERPLRFPEDVLPV
jgi:15-cis-phytoene synthase